MIPSATPPENAEKCFCGTTTSEYDGNADHDRRHTVQHVGGKSHQVAKAIASIFRQVDARADAQRHTDEAGHREDDSGANDGIGHAAARLARRFRRLREKGRS